MPTRAPTLIGRTVACACLLSLGVSACFDDIRSARALIDDPVVMGISLAVVVDGPYAGELASLPADRPRAEVLPLDTVELDARVADVHGLLDLDDATWVLCGDGCLPSLADQGRRFGELPPCHEGSVAESYACLAGRGVRPRVVIPDLVAENTLNGVFNRPLFPRALVVVGSPGGPTTDECLDQLVVGPRVDLRGCGIGVRDLRYGPLWVLSDLAAEAGVRGWEGLELPADISQLLPPNAAPVFEEVRLGANPYDGLEMGEPIDPEQLELHSIDEVLEVEAETQITIRPVVSPRDQQIWLSQYGPDQWFGHFETYSYDVWTDDLEVYGLGGFWSGSFVSSFRMLTPSQPGTFHLYVTATDNPGHAKSWFTLTLRVAER